MREGGWVGLVIIIVMSTVLVYWISIELGKSNYVARSGTCWEWGGVVNVIQETDNRIECRAFYQAACSHWYNSVDEPECQWGKSLSTNRKFIIECKGYFGYIFTLIVILVEWFWSIVSASQKLVELKYLLVCDKNYRWWSLLCFGFLLNFRV